MPQAGGLEVKHEKKEKNIDAYFTSASFTGGIISGHLPAVLNPLWRVMQ